MPRIIALLLTLCFAPAAFAAPPGTEGRDGGGACYGTYLVDVGPSGEISSVGIWTLGKDGTVQVTDSAEVFIGFSHEQGAWKHTVGNGATATLIDFNFNPDSPRPAGYARVVADFAFVDRCNALEGTFDLRLYGPDGDPLDPVGGDLISEDIPFTGRRVNP